jgi:hypothetical protein
MTSLDTEVYSPDDDLPNLDDGTSKLLSRSKQ